MRIKIMAGVTALALAASSVLAVAPANARYWHHGYRHHGYGGVLGGFAAGALIGGALASRPYYGPYYGGYAYEPAPYAGGDAVNYCLSRFKSYDPASGTYLGYDGDRHPCP